MSGSMQNIYSLWYLTTNNVHDMGVATVEDLALSLEEAFNLEWQTDLICHYRDVYSSQCNSLFNNQPSNIDERLGSI
mgnify:FL=1